VRVECFVEQRSADVESDLADVGALELSERKTKPIAQLRIGRSPD